VRPQINSKCCEEAERYYDVVVKIITMTFSEEDKRSLCSEKSDTFVFPYISHSFWTNFMKLSGNICK